MSEISRHPLEGKLTQEQIDKVMSMNSPTEISTYMWELEQAAGLRVADTMNPSLLRIVEPPAEAAKTMSVKVGDQVFTANTTEELAAISERAIQAAIAAKTNADAPARNSDGRFAKQQTITDGADKIVNGLVAKALQEELGIEPSELQAAVAGIRENNQITSTWAQATRDFLKANPDYRGGEETQQAIGRKLQELGLTEQPSAASIQKAYDALAHEAETYSKIKDATHPQSIRDALGITAREQARLRSGR